MFPWRTCDEPTLALVDGPFSHALVRSSFLDELESWSEIESLPSVLVEPLGDGRTVRYWTADDRVGCVTALAQSYGARQIEPVPA